MTRQSSTLRQVPRGYLFQMTPNNQGEKIPGRNAWNKFNIQAKGKT
jgi:hypothetical protein